MNEKLEYLSALELASKIKNKEISPIKVVEYFIKRIELHNFLNAFTYLDFEYARKKAKEIQNKLDNNEPIGKFAGVPIALKDFLPSKKGWPNSRGGVKSLIEIDAEDSIFCEVMEKEDAIVIGKTNAPSFGFRATTDNKLYGPTVNPFNHEYNSGGSSGGSAVAVAAGLVLLAEGGDAGGSIRVPASYNNLVGFKSSNGFIPHVARPDGFCASHPYCISGCLSKDVNDTIEVFSLMSSSKKRDPLAYRKLDIDYEKEAIKPIDKIRIAFTYDFDIFEVEQDIKDEINKTFNSLKNRGFDVEFVHFNFKRSANEYAEIWCESISIDTAIEMELLKRDDINKYNQVIKDVPYEFNKYNKRALKWNILDFYNFNLARTEIYDSIEDVLENYDVIISPTTTCKPIKNKGSNIKGPNKINGKKVERLIGFTETFLLNFSGHPAINIPCAILDDNLPIGLQIIGRKYFDEDVLRVAKTMERLFPWQENFKLSMK